MTFCNYTFTINGIGRKTQKRLNKSINKRSSEKGGIKGLMYLNIKAELSRHNLTVRDLAAYMCMSTQNVYNKLNGKVAVTTKDMQQIQNFFIEKAGGAFSLDYLFKTDITNNGGI